MSSKQLGSILGKVPSATAEDEIRVTENQYNHKRTLINEMVRVSALIPKSLKEEIRNHVKNNKGETETIVILKGLKKVGFNVDSSWLIDKRSMR